MKSILKYGGLTLSSMLTVSLFVDLYGPTAYGITLALFALALFEVGALTWSQLLRWAKGGQRGIVKAAQWFCVVASVVSSAAQIILGTKLWEPGFDVGFVTLLVICAALAVNVMGVFAYEQLDPARAESNRELDRQAKAREAAAKLEDRVIDQSLIKAEAKVAEISGRVSDALSNELRGDVVNYLLAQTRGGDNRPRLPAPTGKPETKAEVWPGGVYVLPDEASAKGWTMDTVRQVAAKRQVEIQEAKRRWDESRRKPDKAALDEAAQFFNGLMPEMAEEGTARPRKPAKNGSGPKA